MKLIALCILLLPLIATAQSDKPPYAALRRDLARTREMGESASVASHHGLTARQRAEFIRLMLVNLGPVMRENGITGPSKMKALASEVRVEIVYLGNHSSPAYIFQAFDYDAGCGGTGNCPTFIFTKTNGEWHPLLQATAERITIRNSSAHGQHDILLKTHDSASESNVNSYRFNGKRYVHVACFDVDWEPAMVPLDVPLISRCR